MGKKISFLVGIFLFIAVGLILFYPQAMFDIYMPTLPFLNKGLNTTKAVIQYIVAFFLLGNAIAQLVAGIISDRFGRRIILFIGLILVVFGGLFCYLAQNAETMAIGRIIQGIGAGAASVSVRSLVADWFSGKAFAKIYSLLIAVSILSIALASVIAAHLMEYFGWRSVMLFIFIYSLIILLILIIAGVLSNNYMPKVKRQSVNFRVIKIFLHLHILYYQVLLCFLFMVLLLVYYYHHPIYLLMNIINQHHLLVGLFV